MTSLLNMKYVGALTYMWLNHEYFLLTYPITYVKEKLILLMTVNLIRTDWSNEKWFILNIFVIFTKNWLKTQTIKAEVNYPIIYICLRLNQNSLMRKKWQTRKNQRRQQWKNTGCFGRYIESSECLTLS